MIDSTSILLFPSSFLTRSLLIFINVRSGCQNLFSLQRRLNMLLNPVRVFLSSLVAIIVLGLSWYLLSDFQLVLCVSLEDIVITLRFLRIMSFLIVAMHHRYCSKLALLGRRYSDLWVIAIICVDPSLESHIVCYVRCFLRSFSKLYYYILQVIDALQEHRVCLYNHHFMDF